MLTNDQIDDGRWYSKIHKSCCCPTWCLPCNTLLHPCRKAVSGNKRRLVENGYDLDLTYLSERIIVHGFPSIGIEHLYRNPRLELLRFLDERHKDHYKVYNFCCEYGRGYSPEVFHGRVERYPFKDHNTPPLKTIIDFGESVKLWLEADPQNVVSMHCKAGKGRAGLMSCIAMIRTGTCQSAKEALDHYDRTRVVNNKGLTVTSQRKYVIFYETIWRKIWGVTGDIGAVPGEPVDARTRLTPDEPQLSLYGVEVINAPEGFLRNLRIKVCQGSHLAPQLLQDSGKIPGAGNSCTFDKPVRIKGNFKVQVDHSPGFQTQKLAELWHNTIFMRM